MDRWKAEMGRVREKRRVEKRRVEERRAEERRSERERVRRKKMQVREKIGKSRNTVFFQWFVAPEGRKVGSLKRSHLARWAMKNCTPLWREAHFQVKMYKAPLSRTTLASWDVEKVHAVVARSTFRVKMLKTRGVRTTFGRWDVVSPGRRKGLCTLSKVSKAWGFCSIFKYKHHYTTLHSNTLHYNYNYTFTTFHYTTLHSAPLHYTTLN